MKRFLAFACVALLVLGLMGTASAEPNKLGWEKPAETLAFTVFVSYDNWTQLEEQKAGMASIHQYLLDEFNVDITFETTDGNAEEKLNLMLASGEYPDVIMAANGTIKQKFVDQGKAADLTAFIDASPNLLKELGDLRGLYADENGKNFYLPQSYGGLMDLPDYSAHLRYDEWVEIGSPEIKTPDDWYNAIFKVLELHPTTPAGETRYSLSLYDQGSPENWLTGYWGLKRGWKIDAENNLTYWPFTDEGKEMAKFFNKIWRTGTMDPDSFVNKHEDFRTKVSQERVVGLIGGWWIGYNAGHEIWSLTNENWNENMRFFQVAFKAPEAENAYLTGKNLYGDSWTIITDKAKDPAAIMQWIDFTCTDPGKALTSWGMPGPVKSFKDPAKEVEIWSINSPTDWKFNDDSKAALLAETWDYNEEGIFGVNQGNYSLSINRSRWADGVHCSWPNQMWYSENKWKNIMFTNMAGTIYDATALAAIPAKSEEIMMVEAAVKDCWKLNFPLVVMAEDDAAFEAAWATLQEDMTNADIATWTQFRTDVYKANLAKMAQ